MAKKTVVRCDELADFAKGFYVVDLPAEDVYGPFADRKTANSALVHIRKNVSPSDLFMEIGTNLGVAHSSRLWKFGVEFSFTKVTSMNAVKRIPHLKV